MPAESIKRDITQKTNKIIVLWSELKNSFKNVFAKYIVIFHIQYSSFSLSVICVSMIKSLYTVVQIV